MTSGYVNMKAVFSIKRFRTIFTGVCKQVGEMNTFQVIHEVMFLRTCFPTHCTDRKIPPLNHLFLDVVMKDAPVWLGAWTRNCIEIQIFFYIFLFQIYQLINAIENALKTSHWTLGNLPVGVSQLKWHQMSQCHLTLSKLFSAQNCCLDLRHLTLWQARAFLVLQNLSQMEQR